MSKLQAMTTIIVDVQVDEGWVREGNELVRGEPDPGRWNNGQSRVLFDHQALIDYLRCKLTGQETGDPPWKVGYVLPFTHSGVGHQLQFQPAYKMDEHDPRSFVRAVCTCRDYTSSVDTPYGAARSWVAHYTAKTRGGIGE